MKAKRITNHLTRYAGITARSGKYFKADQSDWNAKLLFTAARIAWTLALKTTGHREPVAAIPVRLIQWDAASGVHQYEMSDGTVRGLNVTEALRLKNMLALVAEIGRVFSDEPPLRADLLSKLGAEAEHEPDLGAGYNFGRPQAAFAPRWR